MGIEVFLRTPCVRRCLGGFTCHCFVKNLWYKKVGKRKYWRYLFDYSKVSSNIRMKNWKIWKTNYFFITKPSSKSIKSGKCFSHSQTISVQKTGHLQICKKLIVFLPITVNEIQISHRQTAKAYLGSRWRSLGLKH